MPEENMTSNSTDNTPHLKPQMDTEGAAFELEAIATSCVSASPLSRFWILCQICITRKLDATWMRTRKTGPDSPRPTTISISIILTSQPFSLCCWKSRDSQGWTSVVGRVSTPGCLQTLVQVKDGQPKFKSPIFT